MGDRHISQKQKGKVLSSCITPTYLYGQDTMAITDKQRMEELREEVGVGVSQGNG